MNSYSWTFRLSWLVRDCKKLFFWLFEVFSYWLLGHPVLIDVKTQEACVCQALLLSLPSLHYLSLHGALNVLTRRTEAGGVRGRGRQHDRKGRQGQRAERRARRGDPERRMCPCIGWGHIGGWGGKSRGRGRGFGQIGFVVSVGHGRQSHCSHCISGSRRNGDQGWRYGEMREMVVGGGWGGCER